MPRFDPFQLPRAERRLETVTYGGPEDEIQFEATFQEPNASEISRAVEIAEQLMKDHVSGDPELGRPPLPFPDPDVIPTRAFFVLCAVASLSEQGGPGVRTWAPAEWAVFAVRAPEAWRRVQAALSRLMTGVEERLGEPAGAPMAVGCEPRSS